MLVWPLMAILLTEADVRRLLPMPDLIAAMRAALVQYSIGAAQQPLRTVLEIGEAKSFFGIMPAALGSPAAMGAKLVTVFNANRNAGLPTHLATIVLLDHDTGALQAILDGRYITEARTAAVSAVSTDMLARIDTRILAIIGSGVQARSHLEALECVRSFETIRVWSPSPARRTAFADQMRPRARASVEVFPTAHDATADADVIVVATASPVPVLATDDVRDGAHICAVGACRPTHREMDGLLVARGRTFVDSRASAFVEAGDIVMAIEEGSITREHIAGELGELVAGTLIGRQNERQVTIFKSLGMAVEDVAAAHLAFGRAQASGLGTVISL